METRYYICNYCKKEYLPKRRKVQKFCSNSCRVSAHKIKTNKKQSELVTVEQTTKPDNSKLGAMSFAGVGNAAAGSLAVEAMKSIFTKEENKAATKGDLQKLALKLERFQLIKNMSPNINGQMPYFDNVVGVVVYRSLFFNKKYN